MATVSLEGINKVYENGFHAVKDLSVDIADGEFMVLVGPSGCGKTTALRMVAGLEDITSGILRIGGKEANDETPKERDIAMVFQNYALYPHMTVAENIGFALKLRKIPKDQLNAKVKEAADILGLYLYPPQHAAVFCVDEKTAIQALDRLDPVLPLSPGRAERHGFEYYRHGTLSLYAALNTATGRVHGKTAARHTSREFVAFLQEVVSLCPPRQQIHIILDNLSAHKTQAVGEFLQQHPRVRFHFTPTYSSWLNQVEIWFAKIEREVIARGIFTSVSDLARKLRRYINAYSANARPIQWKYSDPTRRARSNEIAATGH